MSSCLFPSASVAHRVAGQSGPLLPARPICRPCLSGSPSLPIAAVCLTICVACYEGSGAGVVLSHRAHPMRPLDVVTGPSFGGIKKFQ